MKQIKTIYLFLVALATLTSCLGSGDDETILYDDAVITDFSLGTMNRYIDGEKTTFKGSNYLFHIDAINHQIYNTDSLPTGTDVAHVICNISTMNNGVAHYRIAGASAYPGEKGNFVITGHSAGDVYSSNPYKFIFSGLERLEDGDLIYVNYNSVRYTYQVVRKEIVDPSNVAALVVETDSPLLTLVTCTPLGTSRNRLLVTAKQISPSYDGASEAEQVTPVTEESTVLPSNEPSFFEGIWNFLTGQ